MNPLDDILKKFNIQVGEKAGRERVADMASTMLSPQKDELLEDRLFCEAKLINFVRAAWKYVEPGPFKNNWHIECICEHLEAMTRLEIKNLVINLPPRCGKSLYVGVFWFCWVWATDPASRWIYASYLKDLTARDAKKSLDIFSTAWYQARWGNNWQLRTGQKSVTQYVNNKMGFRISTSVQGRGLGEGAEYVICDDGNKASEIHYKAKRDMTNDWWSQTISTRSGTDPEKMRKVCVQQRLAAEDLSGYIISKDSGYETLVLPMEYEPNRYFLPTSDEPKPLVRSRDMIVLTSLQAKRPELRDPRTEEGALLWPEHFNEEKVQELRLELVTAASGQLQQRPSPAKGDIFSSDNFRYFIEEVIEWNGNPHSKVECYTMIPVGNEAPITVPKAWCRHFITADTAMTEGTRSDYTALGFFSSMPIFVADTCIGRYLLVVDVVRRRLAVPKQLDFLMGFWDAHPEAMFLAVEPKGSGIGLIQSAAALGRPFKSLKVDGDKIKRSATLAGLYEAKLVLHRRGMHTLADAEDELLGFPTGQHDDVCDIFSYGAVCFTHERILSVSLPGLPLAYPQLSDLATHTEVFKIGGVEIVFREEDDEPPAWYK